VISLKFEEPRFNVIRNFKLIGRNPISIISKRKVMMIVDELVHEKIKKNDSNKF